MALPLPEGWQINYTDFYRYSLSICTVLIVLFCILGAVEFNAAVKNPDLYRYHLGISIFLTFFAALAGIFGVVALRKWYENQKLLDESLRIEVTTKKLELEARMTEHANKTKSDVF